MYQYCLTSHLTGVKDQWTMCISVFVCLINSTDHVCVCLKKGRFYYAWNSHTEVYLRSDSLWNCFVWSEYPVCSVKLMTKAGLRLQTCRQHVQTFLVTRAAWHWWSPFKLPLGCSVGCPACRWERLQPLCLGQRCIPCVMNLNSCVIQWVNLPGLDLSCGG